MNSSECVSINPRNPNYYEWGSNCRRMQMTPNDAQRVLDSFYGANPPYTKDQVDEFWNGFHERPVVVSEAMRTAVIKDLMDRLKLSGSDEAFIGAEELVYTLAEAAGIIPPRLTDEQKLAGETQFTWTVEEAELIKQLRPYMSADDEGVPFHELVRILADRVKKDGCYHDWPEKDGQTDEHGHCTKCGLSFQLYIHS